MAQILTLIKKAFQWLFGLPAEAATTLLDVSEYDASYFDGRTQAYKHNAGYGKYERWYRNDSDDWTDRADAWINHLALSGKKVLDIGCAKGFLVKSLRDRGVDAYGLDVSSYAIGACEDGMAPYLTVGDVRNLGSMGYGRNEFDVVITVRLLECMSDAEITQFVDDCAYISKKMVHLVTASDKDLNTDFYNPKTLEEWRDSFDWPRGTVFAIFNREDSFITK